MHVFPTESADRTYALSFPTEFDALRHRIEFIWIQFQLCLRVRNFEAATSPQLPLSSIKDIIVGEFEFTNFFCLLKWSERRDVKSKVSVSSLGSRTKFLAAITVPIAVLLYLPGWNSILGVQCRNERSYCWHQHNQ